MSHLDTLYRIALDRQAEMRREAWIEQQLRQDAPEKPVRKERLPMKQKFAVALAMAALIAFTIAQAAAAAAAMGGGGGGPAQVM
jgi:hypothetical protein